MELNMHCNICSNICHSSQRNIVDALPVFYYLFNVCESSARYIREQGGDRLAWQRVHRPLPRPPRIPPSHFASCPPPPPLPLLLLLLRRRLKFTFPFRLQFSAPPPKMQTDGATTGIAAAAAHRREGRGEREWRRGWRARAGRGKRRCRASAARLANFKDCYESSLHKGKKADCDSHYTVMEFGKQSYFANHSTFSRRIFERGNCEKARRHKMRHQACPACAAPSHGARSGLPRLSVSPSLKKLAVYHSVT